MSRRTLAATPADQVVDGDPDRAGEGSGEPSRRGAHRTGWWPWLAVLVVVVAALAIGALGERPPATQSERVNAVARTVRCPTCNGESVAQSDAQISQQIRVEIAKGFESGLTEEQIRDRLLERYDDISLDPSGSGTAGLVWALPIIAGLLAVAGLVVVFRRWQRAGTLHASAADEALVAEALAGGDPATDPRGVDGDRPADPDPEVPGS